MIANEQSTSTGEKETVQKNSHNMDTTDIGILCHRISGYNLHKKHRVSVYSGNAVYLRVSHMLLGIYVRCAFLRLANQVGQSPYVQKKPEMIYITVEIVVKCLHIMIVILFCTVSFKRCNCHYAAKYPETYPFLCCKIYPL